MVRRSIDRLYVIKLGCYEIFRTVVSNKLERYADQALGIIPPALAWKDVNTLSMHLAKIVMDFEDTLKTTIRELQEFLSANNITGDPIEIEDKVVIPITRISLGFGSGSKKRGELENNAEISGGAGGGIAIFPVTVLIIFKGVEGSEGIKVMPLGAPSSLSESLSEIASVLVEKFESMEEVEKKRINAEVTEVK